MNRIGRIWARLDTLRTRTVLVLLIGIGVVHLVSLWGYQHALDAGMMHANEMRMADRIVTIRQAVMRASPAQREDVAHDLSGGAIEVHWSLAEHAVAGGAGAAAWAGLGRHLMELAPDLAPADVVIGANRQGADDPHLALISVKLPDASWINIRLVSMAGADPGGHGTLLSTSLMALGAILVSLVLVRWITRPLSTFAEAAGRVYRGTETALVNEAGPAEVRALASAFNDMQRRIKLLVDDRTQALAAVSHDLKTPITRLRFRIEDVEDLQIRDSIAADLGEMERMIDQTLAYLRGERADEDIKPVDLVAILATIAGDLTDLGHEIVLDGASSCILAGRHLALKRAFGNLLHNAVKYGGRAHISVSEAGGDVSIVITDEGPGIAPARMADAFKPFVRLEPSRNRETGGHGLGLPIARAIIEGHGGTISLANASPRGLMVTITLPKGGLRSS